MGALGDVKYHLISSSKENDSKAFYWFEGVKGQEEEDDSSNGRVLPTSRLRRTTYSNE